MDRVELSEREGKTLVTLDFSGLEPEELAAVLEKAAAVIRSQPPKSVYTLTKVDGAHFNGEVIEALKEFAKGNDPYVTMGAIVGLSGLQKLVLTTVSKFSGRNFVVCGDVAEAESRLLSS